MDELNEIMTDTVTNDLEEVCPKIERNLGKTENCKISGNDWKP